MMRTRVVATIGPASDRPTVISAMGAAGMDVARIPLAHGTTEEAIERIGRVRDALPGVGILVDLPGPKLRAAPFPEGGVQFRPGDEVRVVHVEDGSASAADTVSVPHAGLVESLWPGDRLQIGDGGIVLIVDERVSGRARARVHSGGWAQGRPGITSSGFGFAPPTPTPEDLRRLELLADVDIDALAVSFVRSAADIEAVRAAAGRRDVMVVAKIETPEAIADLEHIVLAADGVMIARGDLGIRVPFETVPHLQKTIIQTAVGFGRPVITATQMLESMTSASAPTRAEVADVANAVLDGTSAVMLSAETAVGVDPVGVVSTVVRIGAEAERHFNYRKWGEEVRPQRGAEPVASVTRITGATTAAAWRAASDHAAAAIIACTQSGATARAISRFRPPMPVLAITPSQRTANQLSLSWGVHAVVQAKSADVETMISGALATVRELGYAEAGDIVVMLAGSPDMAEPVTDTVRILRVPEGG